MTAREAVRRYSASWERAAVGFATTLLHHYRGHDLRLVQPSSNRTRSSCARSLESINFLHLIDAD